MQSARHASGSGRKVAVHPLTLAFSDSSLESAYLKQQRLNHISNEPWLQKVHVIAGLLHLTTAAFTTTGGKLFSWASALIIVPYTSVALCQCLAATTFLYQRHRTACALAFEVLYLLLCSAGLPSWVLVEATDIRSYVRDFMLGSGFLVSYWFAFWSNKPFAVDLVAIPAQFGVLAAAMTAPTCQRLDGTPFARATSRRLSASLDALAAATLVRPCAVHACASLLWTWQVVAAVALLHMRYQVERGRRARFVAPGHLSSGWPAVPRLVLLALRLALGVQLLAVLWVALQCSCA